MKIVGFEMKVLVALVTDYVDWLGDCVNIIYQLAVRIQRSDAYRCRDLTFVKLVSIAYAATIMYKSVKNLTDGGHLTQLPEYIATLCKK